MAGKPIHHQDLPPATTSTQGAVQLGSAAGTACEGNDSRLSDSRAPTGSAGGDLTGSYPNPTLAAAGPGATGPIGSATVVPIVTIDAKGRVTALSSTTIASVAPSAHASSHQNGGSDEIATATAAANAIPKAGAGGKLAAGWLQEVLALADLTDVTGTTGSGTVAVLQTSPTFITPVLGAATGTSLAVTGALSTSSASTPMGYATGAGSTVTQTGVAKTGGVTINTPCGQITTTAANLNNATAVKFTVTCSSCAVDDTVVLSMKSGGTSGGYLLSVGAVAAGSFDIVIYNCSGGALAQALVITYAIIKAQKA